MSEEKRLSAFKAFAQSQQTFAEAEEKAKKEAGTPKVERFRIGEDGEYSIRILPLAPSFDEQGNILPMKRKGYEYALHQLFLTIKVPSKKGDKTKKVNIPVIRTTDEEVGYSVDLIETYAKIAKEMYSDDKDLIDMIGGSSYNGGLRWNYQHAIMVLDVSNDKERAKGPQLWQCSHSQYKDIDDAKMRLWRELREDGGQDSCPISGLQDAYPVKVIRKNNNGKTEYTIEIGRKVLDLEEEEVEKLLDLPRIPEQIYRYTRYQYEATLAFLQQYDEEHDMEVCKQSDFIEAAEKLKGELPADDTSHFDLTKSDSKDSDKDDVTIDSLWREYDAIIDQNLSEKSNEYQNLREKIRQFIEDKELDVRISRTKTNQALLEEIDDALDNKSKNVSEESGEPTINEQEQKADDVEDEPVVETPVVNKQEDEPVELEEIPRRRRSRPGQELNEEPAAEEKSEPVVEEETPRRRLHARRMR